MKILLAACNAKYIHSNLAVYDLKAFSSDYDEHVILREYTINQPKDEILKDIYSSGADVVCFSCYIWNISFVRELIHDDAMLEALGNSLFLGVVSCLVSAVIGTLGAVGLSRIHWKTKGILEYISILPLMIPEIILGMVLMAFFYMMNLPFGMLTLLIGHTVFCVPYILMEVKARLAGMDPSLEEAARDLGAGPFRAFWDIILPLIMPAVLSGFLLAFAMSMDDVVISIFINGPRLATLPIKVYTQIKTGVTPEVNALCTIMLVFTLLILLVYNLIGKLTKHRTK